MNRKVILVINDLPEWQPVETPAKNAPIWVIVWIVFNIGKVGFAIVLNLIDILGQQYVNVVLFSQD